MEWAQQQFKSVWKEDGARPRPSRTVTEMDANWWFWNIALSMTPGLLIVAYCELVAKPEMIRQQIELGRQPPPASSLVNSWRYLVDYVLGNSQREETVSSSAAPATESIPSRPMESQQRQQLNALKKQLDALEQQIERNETTTEMQSPMHRRRLDHMERVSGAENGSSTTAKVSLSTLSKVLSSIQHGIWAQSSEERVDSAPTVVTQEVSQSPVAEPSIKEHTRHQSASSVKAKAAAVESETTDGENNVVTQVGESEIRPWWRIW